jgi:energy-coupling factor transporter transmembrane protein EcfT
MWLEIFLIPFVILIVIYFIFWIVHEGTRWQKHPQLGVFARFIQASPRRGFLVFFILFILIIPASILIMTGQWIDQQSGLGPQRVGVVNVMLLLFLIMAFTFPIMYSSLGRWRNAKRAEAEMKVIST